MKLLIYLKDEKRFICARWSSLNLLRNMFEDIPLNENFIQWILSTDEQSYENGIIKLIKSFNTIIFQYLLWESEEKLIIKKYDLVNLICHYNTLKNLTSLDHGIILQQDLVYSYKVGTNIIGFSLDPKEENILFAASEAWILLGFLLTYIQDLNDISLWLKSNNQTYCKETITLKKTNNDIYLQYKNTYHILAFPPVLINKKVLLWVIKTYEQISKQEKNLDEFALYQHENCYTFIIDIDKKIDYCPDN